MQCANIVPITIHHYRNITGTTQNTIAFISNNLGTSRQTNKEKKKLQKMINKIYADQQHFDKESKCIYLGNQNLKEKYLVSSEPKNLSKSRSMNRYKVKKHNKETERYEPLLSTQVQKNSQNALKQSTARETQKDQDSKQFTFGEKTFKKTKKYEEENPESQSQQKRQFDLVSQRNQGQFAKEKSVRARRMQFWENLEKRSESNKKIEKYVKLSSKEQQNISDDARKCPGKYIAGHEAGLSDEQIYRGISKTGNDLNFELQKFIRKKGLDNMKDASLRNQIKSHKILKTNAQIAEDDCTKLPTIKKNSQIKEERKIYPNYIPEVFPKISASRKRIKTENTSPEVYKKQKRQEKNKQFVRYSEINEREEMLGKIVLNRVEDHFANTKQRGFQYFMQVKSEEGIHEAWVEYLKTKINRADYLLSINK